MSGPARGRSRATSDGATLDAALLEVAAGSGDVEVQRSADEIIYRVAGRAFAITANGQTAFRLDPFIAAAAKRTPDVGPSSLGPDWVAFMPAALDQHAFDRARAWFESAARRIRSGA